MNLDSFTGAGSTPSRRRLWDKVTQAVLASQKIQGKNITVDVRDGYGSIISIPSASPGRGGTPHTGPTTGACCIGDGCEELSESVCAEVGGVFHAGQHCSDDTCPCGEGHCGPPSDALGCCLDCGCIELNSDDCESAGGFSLGDMHCADFSCDPCTFTCGDKTPFFHGGSYWESCTTSCDAVTTCTGATTEDALYLVSGDTIGSPCDPMCEQPDCIHTCYDTEFWNCEFCDSFVTPAACDSERDCMCVSEVTSFVRYKVTDFPCGGMGGAFDDPFFQNN